jgi:hypothetical protein
MVSYCPTQGNHKTIVWAIGMPQLVGIYKKKFAKINTGTTVLYNSTYKKGLRGRLVLTYVEE